MENIGQLFCIINLEKKYDSRFVVTSIDENVNQMQVEGLERFKVALCMI
jgi:hypothetical protein